MGRLSFITILLCCCALQLIGIESPCLKKITVTSREQNESHESVVLDFTALPQSEKKLKAILEKYIGLPINKELIQAVKNDIYQFYSDAGRPLVLVKIPEQDVTDGTMKITILETRLGKVSVLGNRYFRTKMLEKSLSLKPGDPIDMPRLSEDLSWLNRNTFLQADLIFAPGSAPGTTDIELAVSDRRPWRLYSGADNTGIPSNNPYRIYTGFNVGNLFGNQMFTYQFTTAPRYSRFYAHTAYYTVPLPWRHILVLFGGYSHVHVPVSGDFHTKGSSAQGSLRYEIPLAAPERIAHELTVGYDYKRLNNDLLFTQIPVFGKMAQITQFVLGYNFGFQGHWFKTSLTVELFASPYQWIAGQSKSDYRTLRAYSQAQYYYGRLAFAPIFLLPKNFTIQPTFRFQGATQNLLSSEQFGIGGYDTVRGYIERLFNGDNAFVANLEFRSPALPLFTTFQSTKSQNKYRESLQFLVFGDYGIVSNHKSVPGFDTGYLCSVGPGLRYTWGSYLSARCDWGVQLRHVAQDSHNYRTHFSAELSY